FIMPFTGYYLYRALSRGEKFFAPTASVGSNRRLFAAGIAGYFSLNGAALLTALECGIQPLLHHTATGQALYCPFGLKTAVFAMMGGNLLVFGWIEAIVTALVVKFLQKQSPDLVKG
ncbi:MAG: energy-coupling factor ABC transporter permease, partial [Candidatus Omnitrophica bacterium]|nr:energy-coupling factor ABC transporter permease [Candidatus Omnitrophota bacterium]